MNHKLYEKVKFVEGENFVTIENTQDLTDEELQSLALTFVEDSTYDEVKNRTILVPSTFKEKTKGYIKGLGYKQHDEVYFVRCHLDEVGEGIGKAQRFKFISLRKEEEVVFKETWRRSMEGSLNAPQSLNMEEQMKSVKKELGPGYVDTCLTAYENGTPIGVVMPHIEPGTKEEGRIFYFGLVPEERGKNKAAALYKEGLSLLKHHFKASYSIGATSVQNSPMLKVFEKCGCTVTERVGVYKHSK
ncbi:GNAT family N-acetyltransferase [Halobacillus faecis]|uniref:N-acetyltransferase n=1 Tax=Halobacillus faecis TaxID=360184 RepID=A0A511WQT6_9BACI|nr:GNAT family N-acetyltransferase [Halobacillus faecis]GEN53367.1 N-acetyltransferase [Halobacillus faecis]